MEKNRYIIINIYTHNSIINNNMLKGLSKTHIACLKLPMEKKTDKNNSQLSTQPSSYITQGFHGAGGGGLGGPSGGTPENMVFLSIPLSVAFVLVKEIKAATRPAFPAKVGSVAP